MSKRTQVLLLSISTLAIVGACTAAPAATTAPATGGPSTAAPATSSATSAPEARTLRLAHSYQDDQPQVRCGAQIIADEVAAANVGLTVEIFGQSQLGGDAARIISVVAGDIDMDIQGASALATVFPPVSAVDGAFVFDDSAHMYEYFSGDASSALKEGFYGATGVTILGGWNTGARQFTANVPIRTPDDLAGLRMRFPPTPTFLLNAEAMGAEAVEVPFEELFQALQQGIADGQENPLTNIYSNNLVEVQDVLSMSAHQLSSNLVIIGRVWDELSPEQQDALAAAVEAAMVAEPECVTETETEILDEWRASGAIEIVEDVDREAFRAKAEPFLRTNFSEAQIEVLDAIRSVVE